MRLPNAPLPAEDDDPSGARQAFMKCVELCERAAGAVDGQRFQNHAPALAGSKPPP